MDVRRQTCSVWILSCQAQPDSSRVAELPALPSWCAVKVTLLLQERFFWKVNPIVSCGPKKAQPVQYVLLQVPAESLLWTNSPAKRTPCFILATKMLPLLTTRRITLTALHILLQEKAWILLFIHVLYKCSQNVNLL